MKVDPANVVRQKLKDVRKLAAEKIREVDDVMDDVTRDWFESICTTLDEVYDELEMIW